MTPARKARRIAVSQGAILDELRYPADGDAPSFAALAACDGSGHIVIDERTWLADCEAVRARVEGSAPMVDPLGLVGLGREPCSECLERPGRDCNSDAESGYGLDVCVRCSGSGLQAGRKNA